MIKLGVFGDSFAAIVPYLEVCIGWPSYIHIKEKDIILTNFAVGGSSIYFSYDQFLKYHKYYEKVVFVATNTRRMWIPSAYGPFKGSGDNTLLGSPMNKYHFYGTSDKDGGGENYYQHALDNNWPERSIKTIEAMDDYYNLIYDPIQDWHNWQLRIQSICDIRPDALIISAFQKSSVKSNITFDVNSQYYSANHLSKNAKRMIGKTSQYDRIKYEYGGQCHWRPGEYYINVYPPLINEDEIWKPKEISLEEISGLDTYDHLPNEFDRRHAGGFRDWRSCHMNENNNKIFGDKIIKWIREGTFENTNIDDYVATHNQSGFMGKFLPPDDDLNNIPNIAEEHRQWHAVDKFRKRHKMHFNRGAIDQIFGWRPRSEFNWTDLSWNLTWAEIKLILLGKYDKRIMELKESIYKDVEV
jgi:hypothetical protein